MPIVANGDSFYLNNVPTFGYNPHGIEDNTYLGPSLIWRHGTNQQTTVYNNLSERTTVHWHGAHIPAKDDGGPHQPIEAFGQWNIDFDILDAVTTLWYHPHLEDSTYIQVEKGLSGIIIIRDAADTLIQHLPHTYGVDDIPVIFQDHQFDLDTAAGTFSINTGKNSGATMIVNGVVFPYLDVGPQMVRFRCLDGSSRQNYNIEIVDDQGNPMTFWMTGSDAGYLPDSARATTSFGTGPGIRNEIVIDFTGHAGETFYMRNAINALKTDWGVMVANKYGSTPGASLDTNMMEIRVGQTPLGSNPVLTPPPSTFPTYVMSQLGNVTRTRDKELQGQSPNISGSQILYSIDGNQFELNRINDTIKFDSTERWNVKNESDVAHPFHIHDVHVDVIAVYDDTGNQLNPIPVEWVGRQDNMIVPAGWQVDFLATFDVFSDTLYMDDTTRTAQNGYMYHCHILTHEDGYYDPNANLEPHGMMQQFLVWNGITVLTSNPESVEHMGQILFYPNPASDILYLQGESRRASEFCMYDLSGKMVRREELIPFNGVKSFDVTNMTPGMYLVEWQDGSGRSFTEKVVLHR